MRGRADSLQASTTGSNERDDGLIEEPPGELRREQAERPSATITSGVESGAFRRTSPRPLAEPEQHVRIRRAAHSLPSVLVEERSVSRTPDTRAQVSQLLRQSAH